MDDRGVTLQFWKTGECSGEERKIRHAADQPSVTEQDRLRIHRAADELIEENLKPTPGAVQDRLNADQRQHGGQGGVHVPSLRAILRGRKRLLGLRSHRVMESAQGFVQFAQSMQNPDAGDLCFVSVTATEQAFRWATRMHDNECFEFIQRFFQSERVSASPPETFQVLP